MPVITMLKKRVISAVIGIVLLLILVFSGSFTFFMTAAALVILGIREFSRIIEVKSKLLYFLLNLTAVLIVFNAYLISNHYNYLPYGAILFFTLFCLYLYNISNYQQDEFFKNISYQFLGIIYIGGGLSFAVFLRDFNSEPFFNTSALWFVLIATWLTDTGAYFIGKKFGSRPLAPLISPNKTIAGAIGGIATTAIFIIVVGLLTGILNFYFIFFALLFPIVAIMGDLFESCLKRDFQIKDTGNILPGHGGILDRFDSFIFTAPFTYYILYILLG